MQPARQAGPKVCQKRAPRPPLAPPRAPQEFLGGSRDWFSSWGFGTLELPERAPRLGKTTILAVSAMSGLAWPSRVLKDMTSMSGLRQGFPQENTFGSFNTLGVHGARQIQCAAHRPPRVGVVLQRVVMHGSSFGRLIRIRFCRNHVKSSGSRGRNWLGMLRRPREDRKFQKFVEVWPETDRRIRKKCNLDGRQAQKYAKSMRQDRPLHHPRPSRNSSAGTASCFKRGVLALWSCRNERPA